MRGLAVTVVMALGAGGMGCLEVEASPPPGDLEIGVRGPNDEFVPLEDGDVGPVGGGVAGLFMLWPSLRAVGIDPHGPEASIAIQVLGIQVAPSRPAAWRDMLPDGDGYVLWDMPVPFQTELCCYVCRDGLVEAQLVDDAGRRFRGEVTVVLSRGECPDPDNCCESAEFCPDPALAQLCE